MNDVHYINIIIRLIEKKLNWPKVIFWTDNNYKRLGQLVFKDTGISISPQTLKRLFGKVKYKESYTPQPATKEALSMFVGFKDWDSFVSSQTKTNRKLFDSLTNKSIFRPVKITILLVTFAILLSICGYELLQIRNKKEMTFYAENVTGKTPHTVSFHYDISKLAIKNVYIDFDQNEAESQSQVELLDKSRQVINHCFETPGFYHVKMLINDKVESTVNVHVLSEGWISYYFNDDNFSQRKFIFGLENKVRDNRNDGQLYISPGDLSDQGFNGNTVYYLEHMQYDTFNVPGDHCIFEVKYQNNLEIGGISCYDAEFRIIGENGLASVMLVQQGCHRWSEVTIGEVYLNGKYDDLTSLSLDLSHWSVLKIIMEKGKAVVTNRNDTIFSCVYQQPIGSIEGIRLVTKGSGAFDYVRLFNENNNLVYENNFESSP
jgi:ribosomal protein L9